MLPINLKTRADVVVIPPRQGREAVTARQDVSAACAIRYVVEQLPKDERSRAVVCTATALLFIEEIEALYGLPEFPKPARSRSALTGSAQPERAFYA